MTGVQTCALPILSLFPLYTGVAIAAMVVSGVALDRFGTARLIPLYQLPMVIAFLVFAGIYLMISLTASILREQVTS